MSDSSEFCWMCGATRNSSPPALKSFPPAGEPSAPRPVLHSFSQPANAKAESASPGVFVPGTYSYAATAAAPRYDAAPAQGPQPVPEPVLFSHLYGRPQEEAEDQEDEERTRKFDYRIAVLAALLLAIVMLGYNQRHNALALYQLTRQTIAEQVGELWGSTQPAVAERKNASSPRENRAQPRTKVHRASAKSPEPAGVVTEHKATAPRSPFLRVRVEGQPGPELISYAPLSAGAFMGDMLGSGLQMGQRSLAPPFAVTISPRESLSLLLKQVPPIYPPLAQASGAIGPVVLKALIYKDGNIGDLSVVTGSPLLTQAAIDAVRQWVYRPYYRNGEPMDVETLVVVDFPAAVRAEAGKQPRN